MPAEGHADIVPFRLVIFPRSGIGEADRFTGRNAAFRLLLAPDRQPRAGTAAVIPQELCTAKRVIQAERLIGHCGIDNAVNEDMHLIPMPAWWTAALQTALRRG